MPFDLDAVGGVERRGPGQEAGGGGALLVGVDLGVGQAGVIIDSGVDVVVADPAATHFLAASVCAPPTAVGDAPELLDVDVHQRPRVGVLVALSRVSPGADDLPGQRVALAQQRGVVACQDPPDRGGRQADLPADPDRPAPGEHPRDPHPRLHTGRRPTRVVQWAAGPVDQPSPAQLAIPAPPPPRRRARDAHLRGDVSDRATSRDALDHHQPACRVQPSVSVRHERPPLARAGSLSSSHSTRRSLATSTTFLVSTARR